jgi:hypothetical protein
MKAAGVVQDQRKAPAGFHPPFKGDGKLLPTALDGHGSSTRGSSVEVEARMEYQIQMVSDFAEVPLQDGPNSKVVLVRLGDHMNPGAIQGESGEILGQRTAVDTGLGSVWEYQDQREK